MGRHRAVLGQQLPVVRGEQRERHEHERLGFIVVRLLHQGFWHPDTDEHYDDEHYDDESTNHHNDRTREDNNNHINGARRNHNHVTARTDNVPTNNDFSSTTGDYRTADDHHDKHGSPDKERHHDDEARTNHNNDHGGKECNHDTPRDNHDSGT